MRAAANAPRIGPNGAVSFLLIAAEMKRPLQGMSVDVHACLVLTVVSALVFGGCSESGGSAEVAAPSPPTTASMPAPDGGTAERNDAGSPAPRAESSFGPDICGNGKDDDGNGVIDDGCSVPACSLGVLRQFEIPLHASLVFDHGRGTIAAYGGPTSSGLPSAQGIWQYDETGKELAPRRPIIMPLAESALLKTKGGFVGFAMTEPPAPTTTTAGSLTLPLDDALAARGPGKPTVQTHYVTVVDGTMWTSMDGSANTTDDGSSIDIKAFDASTASAAAHYKITIDAGKGAQRLYDVGGVPFYGRASSNGAVARTQLVRLGASAPAWTSEVMVDSFPAGAWLEFARSAGTVATCAGGYVDRSAGYRYACHTLDVTDGHRIADFSLGYPFADDMTDLMMQWGSDDGWLVARIPSTPFQHGAVTTQTVRLDTISRSGKLTANVLLVTVPELAQTGNSRAFKALGPNLYALVTEREPSGWGYATAVVTVIGCH